MQRTNGHKAVITNTHTTMIEVAEVIVCQGALRDPYATRITLGKIERTARGARGKYRVKFTDINGAILLQIRGNLYVQDIRVFTDNIQATRTHLAQFAATHGYAISFGKSVQDAR